MGSDTRYEERMKTVLLVAVLLIGCGSEESPQDVLGSADHPDAGLVPCATIHDCPQPEEHGQDCARRTCIEGVCAEHRFTGDGSPCIEDD